MNTRSTNAEILHRSRETLVLTPVKKNLNPGRKKFSAFSTFTRFNNWRASVASETLTGVTQSKIGDVCLFIYIYVWTYVCHFVL